MLSNNEKNDINEKNTINIIDITTTVISSHNNDNNTFITKDSNNIINNINSTTLKQRLDDKYSELIKLQNNLICIDAGGCSDLLISADTINCSLFRNILQKELEDRSNLDDYIFVDISDKFMNPIINIMRQSKRITKDKKMLIILDVDKHLLIEEIKKFFQDDADKVIEKCEFVYSSKKLNHITKIINEEKLKEITKKSLKEIYSKQYIKSTNIKYKR